MRTDTCIGMTVKELREEIDRLVTEMSTIQTRVNELAAKLITITKEEMRNAAIRQQIGDN